MGFSKIFSVPLIGLALLVLPMGCGVQGDARSVEAAARDCNGPFTELAREWNSHTGVVVGAYLDPGVSAFDYVDLSAQRLPELSALIVKMEDLLPGCDPDLARFYGDVVDNYRDKRDALAQLEAAVADLSIEGEEDAQRAIERANVDFVDIACRASELGGEPIPGLSASACD